MGNEYFSFEKVLKELQLDEEELKRMVSEGQIRAFRDEDKMKFRAEDVDGLRKGRQTDPTIILPGSGVESADGADDEIALVEDDTSETLLDLDEAAAEEAPKPKPASKPESRRPAARRPEPEPEPEEAPAGASTLDEELVLDDDAALSLEGDDEDQVGTQPMAAATQETFVDEDEEVGMTTEPLELVDEDEAEVKKPAKGSGRKATEREAADDKPKTVVASKRETVRAPARSGRTSGAKPAQVSHLGWTMGLVACWLLLLYGFFIFVELLGKPGSSSIGAPVAKMVDGMFLKDGWAKDTLGKKAAKAAAGEEGGDEAGAGE